MQLPRLTPRAYRKVTLLALLALAFIVVTGGAVRVTGSGLGCPDWPTCAEERVVAPLEYHAMVEFVNRMITGFVSVMVIVAVLGSLRRVPRRRDLVWLSLGLVGGVLAQIVLGGLTVLFELAPPFVMGHFLVSMVLIWNAVVLHERAGVEDSLNADPPIPRVGVQRMFGVRWLTVLAAVVIALGTVVTASGPHGGDPEVERLGFVVADVARVHGFAVWVFLLSVIVSTVSMVRAGVPVEVLRRAQVLLVVLVAQAAVGYVQYFSGVPAVLVGVHIAGATAVWIAVLRLDLAAAALRVPAMSPVPVGAQ